MPAKFTIHAKPAPPRLRPIGKLGIVDWREDCSSCHNCVKRSCVYGLYRDEADTLHDEIGYLDYIYQCKGCLQCVQDCTKGILTRIINPEYERLGDEYFTPDIIQTTWYQSEAGNIPVSGSGYGGPFSGSGFDSMWTDMSEIVRPTRDGIHGREYISTSVDIGRTLPHLSFQNGALNAASPPLIEKPLPLIFDILPEHWHRGPVIEAAVEAAGKIGTSIVLSQDDVSRIPSSSRECMIPILDGSNEAANREFASTPFVMIEDSENLESIWDSLKKENANRIIAVRVKATPDVSQRVLDLSCLGIEVILMVFDSHGREFSSEHPRHVRDVLRDVHGALIQDGSRDQITLIASGGIALPEHWAKAIICGADLIAIDIPLLIALECRLCLECSRDGICPIELHEIDSEYAVQRIVNLIGAWRNQLIELLGAMGIREVRRLRGETGRCMFFEDLERNTFGRLYGKRKDETGLTGNE